MAMHVCECVVVIQMKNEAESKIISCTINIMREEMEKLISDAINSGIEFLEIKGSTTLFVRIRDISAIEIMGSIDSVVH